MIIEALQLLQLFKGLKDLCDSDEQTLVADQVETMVKGIGSEMEELANQVIKEDTSQAFEDLHSYLKG